MEFGISETILDTASNSDILILAVKPQIYPEVIKQIKEHVKESVIIVVIAAGQKIDNIKALFERDVKVVRTMPNTPALVGEGMAAICPSTNVTDEETESICKIFNSFGKSEIVSEKLMDVVTAVSGSSPAFIFMLIEAMADGAVLEGMSRDKAYKFASQAVLGSAKMVLDTKKHPAELKDMVCSPGGTTIEGVSALERNGFRASVIDAIHETTEKSRKLSN